ncbi:MAG TPA: AbrB/MazE/SpoVT family DNA-binding domain-containing protein [Hyphomicrobiaceae bacterium]|nr:AbrB/MazE/SpoVT family DNA-binding domain-containing protein [Hyphomicrobiaceae bacterium]
MKVEKWCDDLAIRLPAEIVEVLDFKEGDEVDIQISGPDTFGIECARGTERMFERLGKEAPRRERHVC